MAQSFGQLLRSRRRDAGISQRRLAEEVGVDFSYVSKLENDRIPAPAGDTILRIAKAVRCDAEELLAAARKMPSQVEEAIVQAPEAQRFLQAASSMKLSRKEWEALIGKLESLRDPGQEGSNG
ncbi:MAG: helix-turn-helix transcriptional regulator [Phycisphaerae bacterium]|nr:helix-turn-helix transcriptional regulator [Phycisphaerae bacterium]